MQELMTANKDVEEEAEEDEEHYEDNMLMPFVDDTCHSHITKGRTVDWDPTTQHHDDLLMILKLLIGQRKPCLSSDRLMIGEGLRFVFSVDLAKHHEQQCAL